MITTLYYYNHYKPHMITNSKEKVVKQKPFKQTMYLSQKTPGIKMSKAFKQEVVDYVENLSSGINNVKSSMISLKKRFKNFDEEIKYRNAENIKDDVIIALEDFVKGVNEVKSISENTSDVLNSHFDKVKNILNENQDLLKKLKITLGNGEIKFDTESFEKINIKSLKKNKNDFINIFNDINKETNAVLSKPMTSHMEFRNFSYYFDYRLGSYQNDTFGLFKAGNIVDIQL